MHNLYTKQFLDFEDEITVNNNRAMKMTETVMRRNDN